MSPAFSAESIKANESLIVGTVERFCETLKPEGGGWGRKWNMTQMSTYLGFDIMGALVFGCDFESVQEVGNRALAESVLPASMLMYWVRSLNRVFVSVDADEEVDILLTTGFLGPSIAANEAF